MNKIANLPVPQNAGKFLTRWGHFKNVILDGCTCCNSLYSLMSSTLMMVEWRPKRVGANK